MKLKHLVLPAAALTGWWATKRAVRPYYPDIALQAGMELLSQPRRVLALGPHPGDLEFFCGGTLFLLNQNGGAVTAAVMSAGERATNRANIGEVREREAESSAQVLGCRELVRLNLPDGSLGQGDELRQALAQLWHRVRPEVVLAFDPKGPLPARNNPDHVALGAAVMERVRDGITEGARVYFYGTRQPNVLVDITETVQEKITAVLAHRSQLRGPDWLTSYALRLNNAKGGGTPAMYAEAYYRLV